MTSNLGADALARLPEGVPSTEARPEVMETVRAHFPPEFLNRIDDMILFNRLSRQNMTAIVDVQIHELEKHLHERHMHIRFTKEARHWLAEKGFDEVYGARPLKRVRSRYIWRTP